MSAIENTIEDSLQKTLQAQKEAYLDEGYVSYETRIDRLDRALSQVLKYQDEICEALISDFGHRSKDLSKLTDVAASVGPLKHAKKHLKKWMKNEKRNTMFPLGLLGARSRIEYQPLGVIGILSPWNFPVNLTFGPLASALAAGNRAMIKPSEFTPATSSVIKKMLDEVFDETEVAVVTGGPEVGAAFSALPFDHMIFTGATSVGRHVMAAAAKNLVPVTLELGGKSPVLIGRTANLDQTADRVMMGKTMNAGQVCLAPDYLMVAEEQCDSLVELLKVKATAMFPTIKDNDDYTSVVNERHYQRLNSYLDDAKEKGATIIPINPANEDFSDQKHHKIPPTLVLGATDDMLIMQEEICGPLLPVRTYKEYREAINYVNSNPRPLGLYYFGHDAAEEAFTLTRTTSGGVTLNDVIMHITQEDLPFGGVGPSGMGSYHGFDGFKTFSHAKAIYKQSNKNIADMVGLKPPFGKKTKNAIKMQLK